MKKTNKKTLAFTFGLSFFASSGIAFASSTESAYQDSLKKLEESKKLEQIQLNKSIREAQKEDVEVQIELLQAMQQLEDLRNPKKEEDPEEENKVTIDNFLKFEESYTAEQFEEDSYELEVGGQDYGIDYEAIADEENVSSLDDLNKHVPEQDAYVSSMGRSTEGYSQGRLTSEDSGISGSVSGNGFSLDSFDEKKSIDNIVNSKEMMSKIEAMVNERVHEVISFKSNEEEASNANEEEQEAEGSENGYIEPVEASLSAKEYLSAHAVAMRNYVMIAGKESVDLFVFQNFNEVNFLNKRTKVGDRFVVDAKVSGLLKELTGEYIVVELTYDDGESRIVKDFKGSFYTND